MLIFNIFLSIKTVATSENELELHFIQKPQDCLISSTDLYFPDNLMVDLFLVLNYL